MVVTPILQLSLVCRLFLSQLINRDHEVMNRAVLIGALTAVLGSILVSLDTDELTGPGFAAVDRRVPALPDRRLLSSGPRLLPRLMCRNHQRCHFPSLASPACAPSAAPTSCASEAQSP